MNNTKTPFRWLRVDRLLGEYRVPQDSAAGRRQLEQALERRRAAEGGDEYKSLRRGWFFGGQTLKEELLAAVNPQAGGWHYGEALRESAEARAERIVAEELKRRRWDARTLAERRKGGCWQSCDRAAVAKRNDDDIGLDRAAIAHGDQNASGALVLLAAPQQIKMKKHDTIDRPEWPLV